MSGMSTEYGKCRHPGCEAQALPTTCGSSRWYEDVCLDHRKCSQCGTLIGSDEPDPCGQCRRNNGDIIW